MTFSFNVKDEVTRVESSKAECIAELSAIIRNSGDLTDNLQIHIENNAVARRIFKLFKNIYDIIPVITVRYRYNFSKNLDAH
jgi:DNA-binding transcriptional regulator WhiA